MSARRDKLAQILSLADQFNYLTLERPGQARLSPLDVIATIEANGSISPALLKQARALFKLN